MITPSGIIQIDLRHAQLQAADYRTTTYLIENALGQQSRRESNLKYLKGASCNGHQLYFSLQTNSSSGAYLRLKDPKRSRNIMLALQRAMTLTPISQSTVWAGC